MMLSSASHTHTHTHAQIHPAQRDLYLSVVRMHDWSSVSRTHFTPTDIIFSEWADDLRIIIIIIPVSSSQHWRAENVCVAGDSV